MEALLFTAAMLGLMTLALVVLARFWPRSSRRTGYRVWRRSDDGAGAADGEPPVPEDDDVHWDWRDGPGSKPS